MEWLLFMPGAPAGLGMPAVREDGVLSGLTDLIFPELLRDDGYGFAAQPPTRQDQPASGAVTGRSLRAATTAAAVGYPMRFSPSPA
jgi:hypothetical protein